MAASSTAPAGAREDSLPAPMAGSDRDARFGALYPRLRSGPHGRERDHEQVLSDQRARLCGAMVEAVAQRGYPAVSVLQTAALAGVSTRSFYEHFSGKEECFLATFDAVVSDGMRRLADAHEEQAGWEARLRALFERAIAEVAQRQKESRLVVVEAFAAGPAGRMRVEGARAIVRQMVASNLEGAFGSSAPPPLAVKGIAHGVWHLVCSRLLGGGLEELPGLTDELYAWMLTYRSPAGALGGAPEIATARAVAPPCEPPAGDERRRLLRAALEIAGRRGCAGLTDRALLDLARVDADAFAALYKDVEECLLDALELLAAEGLAPMLSAARAAPPNWPAVTRGAIAALLDWLARDPVLARVAFVEAFCAEPAVLAHAARLLGRFAGVMSRSMPARRRLSTPIAEAIVGAVWGTLHDYVAAGMTDRLPELTDHLSYIVLAPTMGAQAAIEGIRAAARAPSRQA